MSVAFVTETDAGKIMGKMSWIRGNNEAILLRYPWPGICMRVWGVKDRQSLVSAVRCRTQD